MHIRLINISCGFVSLHLVVVEYESELLVLTFIPTRVKSPVNNVGTGVKTDKVWFCYDPDVGHRALRKASSSGAFEDLEAEFLIVIRQEFILSIAQALDKDILALAFDLIVACNVLVLAV